MSMSADSKKRDRIRALVREVLETVPGGETPKQYPEHVRVNSLEDEPQNKEYDRDESAKSLLTEDDFLGLESGAKVRVAEGVKLTPSVKDLIAEKGIRLVVKDSREESLKVKSVGIGCDHGGFELKEKLKVCLAEHGLHVRDFGTDSKDAVDYPDFAHAVAQAVANGSIEVGIVIDGAGIGSAMAAGKVPGVRPAACYNPALARNSREHNGANVLTLGSGQNSYEEAKEIIHAFITTEITEPRHKKRVGKIDAIERQYREH